MTFGCCLNFFFFTMLKCFFTLSEIIHMQESAPPPLSFDDQEDPRLKYPVHMRNKNSLEPGDLGPLPVSTVTVIQLHS